MHGRVLSKEYYGSTHIVAAIADGRATTVVVRIPGRYEETLQLGCHISYLKY